MSMTTEYLKEHFEELIPVADGQEIDLVPEGMGAYRLQVVPANGKPSGNTLWGAMRGKIWIADDFDSPETNKEIEDLFYGAGQE